MAPSPPAGKTVLIVDDAGASRRATAGVLSGEGYAVEEARDGRAALAVLREGGADLVLLDMLLPVLDGWGFLAEKDADPALAPIPVVIMSGLSVADLGWALSLGAAGYLRKPVDVAELLDEVRRLC